MEGWSPAISGACGPGQHRGARERQGAERNPTVGGYGDLHLDAGAQVREEDVAELVRCQAWVAAGEAQVVSVRDPVRAPGPSSIGGPAVEQPAGDLLVGGNGHLERVDRVDGDRGLRLVPPLPADVDVLRDGPWPPRGTRRNTSRARQYRRDHQGKRDTEHRPADAHESSSAQGDRPSYTAPLCSR